MQARGAAHAPSGVPPETGGTQQAYFGSDAGAFDVNLLPFKIPIGRKSLKQRKGAEKEKSQPGNKKAPTSQSEPSKPFTAANYDSARNRDDALLPHWIKHLGFHIRPAGRRTVAQTSVT